jgi:hypothetical protein
VPDFRPFCEGFSGKKKALPCDLFFASIPLTKWHIMNSTALCALVVNETDSFLLREQFDVHSQGYYDGWLIVVAVAKSSASLPEPHTDSPGTKIHVYRRRAGKRWEDPAVTIQ